MRSFIEFFAQRRTLANLLIIMILLLGLNTMFRINRDLYPKVDFGFITIETIYPGASPEDVELNVTNKIEKELKNITGIERTTSISMENVSYIMSVIDIDAQDQDKVKDDIREAVARVTDLPEEVQGNPRIREWSTTTHIPVIEVGVTGDVAYHELREFAKGFEKELREIPGVARIDRYGYLAREIEIEVSPESLKHYQIPLREIIMAIAARNIRTTAGNFESYTNEKNLVTLAQFEDPLNVGDVIVRSTFEGPLIRIKNLALIKDTFEEQRVISRMNGKSAISFIVYKDESADIITTSNAVKEFVKQETADNSENIVIEYSADLSKYVSNRFNVVLTNGIIGLIFVILILTVFLNIRASFWVAVGIPISFFGIIFLLPFFGYTLDSIALSSMILVIGIIVDDAIIIAENIYRRREKGDKPLAAAVEGTREVFKPVLTTILTTIVAFAPMFFMTGRFGKFITVIPLVVSLALTISLLEALIALPAHLLPGVKKKSAAETSASRAWFGFLRERYQGIVRSILKFRYVVIPIFAIVLGCAVWYGVTTIKFILFPTKMATDFYMLVELPIGNSLKASSDKVKEIEELVSSLPPDELESFVTRVGYNPWLEVEAGNYAALAVSLTPYNGRTRTADEIVEELRQRTDSLEGFVDITYEIESGGPPVGSPISLSIVANDDSLRKVLADSVVAVLNMIPGAKDIMRDDKSGKDQVSLKLNYNKLARYGLTVADIARNMRIAYDGEVVTSVRYGDEDVDFRLIFQEEYREDVDFLRNIPVPNYQGRLIPLGDVAQFVTEPGPASVRHYKNERVINISGDVDQRITTATEVIEEMFAHFDIDKDWPGARVIIRGEVMETEESIKNLMWTFIIAAIGIYFILVLLFNSFVQPFIVMTAIPFGIVGVIIAFALHAEPMSFVGMLGVIGLAGVVVNDSLVLVNHVNRLRHRNSGGSVLELTAQGTADRLRAVILTTLTTIAGLIPLAYGFGGSDPFMAPTALALGYGLLFATPLTLILVPCLYLVQYDIKNWLGQLLRHKKG
jgi:multidrug efflux pump subunit AcrB